MTEEEIKDKSKLYGERHYFWRDKIITQLGYSINLFLTIGIATLGYLISEKEKLKSPKVLWNFEINFIYIIIIFFLFASILSGCISVISRLVDLRITSHTFRVRKRTVEKLNKLLPTESPEIDDSRFISLVKVLFGNEFKRVKESDYTDIVNVRTKFNYHRDLTRKFGELTWSTHSFQIGFLVFAIIIYALLFLVD